MEPHGIPRHEVVMISPDQFRIPARLRARHDEIVERTDAFAGEHLNTDYAALCRRMTAALARARPSPLERGEARTWAAGIVYAVGWVNFLSDPSQEPHMTTAELAERMGVGQSTIAARFRQIREVIDLAPLDPEWTLPGRLLEHPFAWLVLVDGVPIDIRDAPRALQEEAFRQGAIPFIPADGPPRPEEMLQEQMGGSAAEPEREGTTPSSEPDQGGARRYQLKITLLDVEPPIWRRVLVPEDTTLAGLHRVVQAAMGWADRHLWSMQIGGSEYSDVQVDGWGESVRQAGSVRLSDVAGPGDVLLYEYDFGDAWEHRIQVEKVLPAGSGEALPVCMAAARACPPEDCGGVPGYEQLLDVLADPGDPEHEALLDWLGGPFDPESVPLDEIDRRLARTEPRVGSMGRAAAASTRPHNSAEGVMREVRAQAGALLQRVLSENPEATIEELNAALQGTVFGYNLRPQAQLGGLSPAQMQRLLSADWEGEGSAVRLSGSLALEDLAASRTLHNARLFLSLLDERGAVKATPKGNLPRAFVAAMDEAMRWPEHLELRDAGPRVKNEEDVFPLHVLRILLELGGLIKRHKGLFSLTRAGERLADEARAGELFATLFHTHFRRLNLAFLDGVESLPEFQHTISYALYRFGQVGIEWNAPLALKADLVLPEVADLLPQRGPYDSWEIVLQSRLLQPLEGLGLAEVRTLPRIAGEWRDRNEYRKSPLFDRFVRFDLER